MGLLRFLRRLFFGAPPAAVSRPPGRVKRADAPRIHAELRPRRWKPPARTQDVAPVASALPYPLARFSPRTGGYLDLRVGGDPEQLDHLGLPRLETPDEIARWLDIPVGKLGWLIDRFQVGARPADGNKAHYHFHWIRKRTGGWRLVEAPKSTLKRVQTSLLRNLLDRIPLSAHVHGFTTGKSMLTNARPHAGKAVVVKLDLENFYPNVGYARVVAIFRGLGYGREAAIRLGLLTTSALPQTIPFPEGDAGAVRPYLRRHLPQGAPTSPALANLSAYALDVRLAGLAKAFGAEYTRYADDLTFSGDRKFDKSLRLFIPLARTIIRQERFHFHRDKLRILRPHQRQIVTGVVVNQRPNISRREYDRIKAVLTNCVRHGPASQNRAQHADFAAHLRGKVAHVAQLNAARGAKLLALYQQIRWT